MAVVKQDETIAAVATLMGEAGIGIVRMSGSEALRIAGDIFRPSRGSTPPDWPSHTVRHGWIADVSGGGEIIDEVLLTVMRAPRSYTREDVVEIGCHGGLSAVRRVLDVCLLQGARPAGPGEFTRRAFLNGRIDLTQAEAVIDIIKAKTDIGLKAGMQQLRGKLSGSIRGMRAALLEAAAGLEAQIDFSEEDIGSLDGASCRSGLLKVLEELERLIHDARYGRLLREGIRVVICGRPNVGKSSLLNALLKQERSIVTSIAGTTRDTIEEMVDMRGIPVRLVDTAGILKPRNLIERKAVARSRAAIDTADLIMLVFDGSARLAGEDKALMKRMGRREVIAVINKADLKQRIEKDCVRKNFPRVVELSARKMRTMSLLEDAVMAVVFEGRVQDPGALALANQRHLAGLKQAHAALKRAFVSLGDNLSLEFVVEDIKAAIGCFDDITGTRIGDDVLDKIFAEFCIGK